jgi:hypothetical protein
MDSPRGQALRFPYSEAALNRVKLELFRGLPTSELKSSRAPGRPGSLKTRPDGADLNGHRRISVLIERGENVHKLLREILEPDHES